MHIGQYGLCLKSRELKASHCLPAALYRLARDPGRKDPNPVVIKPASTITSSRQVSSHFLCEACEQRFSSGGESLVLAECARSRTEFKLRQRIMKLSPLEKSDDPSFAVYDAHAALGGALDNYLYFAASVFWRASAHKWIWGVKLFGGFLSGTHIKSSSGDTCLEKRTSQAMLELSFTFQVRPKSGLPPYFLAPLELRGPTDTSSISRVFSSFSSWEGMSSKSLNAHR
jgi:hypothetical protein